MAYITEELVSSYKSSGLPRKQYCAQNDIAVSALQYHIKKYNAQKAATDYKCSTDSFIPIKPSATVKKSRTVLLIKGDIELSEIIKLFHDSAV